MAKQTIVTYPAVAKDSKLGTPIADAFKMVNDNFNELYAEPSIGLVGNILTLTRPDDTTSTVDLSSYLDEDARAIASGVLNPATGIVTFTRDDASTFTIDLSGLLDTDTIPNDATITLTAGDGLTGGGSFTTDQSGAATITFTVGVDNATTEISSDQVIVKDLGITTAKLANDAVTYDKIGTEFTTSAVISASDVDFSSAQVFTKTLSGATTLTFSNVSTGMVKDLVITGNETLTLPASVKTISGTYDGTVSNLIQIVSTNGSTEQWATISQEA